ncbi:MAG: TIGR01906 family membrane protein [Clostridiales bacterium]|jgi:integral membrane protein (TIGR01906 family)|nr:TIGR01906 family membrane protein [Clostridiales bacterium]
MSKNPTNGERGNILVKIASIASGGGLYLFLLYVCVWLPTFNLSFYSREYDKYGVPATIQVSKADLMQVTRHMLGYMMNKKPDLVISTTIDGQTREFFNDREKSHMADVLGLFNSARIMKNAAIVLFVICLLLSLAKRSAARFFKTAGLGVAALGGFTVAVFGIIAINFDRAFTLFHQIFFNNDLWILDPHVDLLVNIVPFGFFIDISLVVGGLFVASVTLTAVVFLMISGRLKKCSTF